MNRPHSHRNLLWSGHWPVVFHKQTGTLLYSLFVSWSFYWQSNGRVDGFTMCTLSDAYTKSVLIERDIIKFQQIVLIVSKHSVNHVFSSPTSIINFTSKKPSYDDTRRSGRDNELLQRAQNDL